MDPEDGQEGQEDEGPVFAWLPPEDRLWRHPSEVGGPRRAVPTRRSRVLSTRKRPVTVSLCAGTLGAVLAISVGMATGMISRHTVVDRVVVPSPSTAALAVPSTDTDAVGAWASIANQLAPSVVAIRTSTSSGKDLSSGVIYTANDDNDRTYILTAADVASGGTDMTVVFDNGQTEAGHLVGTDPASGIALLWVAGDHRTQPPIGSVDTLQVADPVLAVGGRTAGSTPVGNGTVTALDDQVDTEGGTYYSMLAISGGSFLAEADGGALVDTAGAVIGIATDLASVDPDQQGLAYAVPIDMARHVADELLAGHQPSHPWIGINDATDLSTSAANGMGLSGGAQVGSVTRGSPAAADGVVAGDVVTAFDGQPVTSSGTLVMLLALCQPDQQTTITYVPGTYVAGQRKHTGPITIGVAPGSGG